MRIASLVPSTTEIVAALGRGSELVARTHECDHPSSVADVPAVTGDLLPPGLDPAAIDDAVAASVHDAHTIYALDAAALTAARPDVILTQATCAVCAVDLPTVDAVACTMPQGAEVVSFDPTRLGGIVTGMATVGDAVGATRDGLALAAHLSARLDWLRTHLDGRARPRVAVVEWPDPIYAPGHWVPDMVDAAGATSVFGEPGGRSVRATIADLAATRPDIVVMAYCGYDLATTMPLVEELVTTPGWRDSALSGVAIAAFDGSAYFSRPGPRIVDGAEAMAWMWHRPHPDLRPARAVGAVLRDDGWTDLADLADGAPLPDPATVGRPGVQPTGWSSANWVR
jgi:iron complex transport system substrate-binding protein